MYELRLNKSAAKRFKVNAKKKMLDRGWKCQQLADYIGRPINSVYDFFSTSKWNRFIAAEIATALNMNSEDWR